LSAGDLEMEEAVVTSVEFPLQYTNVKFTFQNIGNHLLFVQREGTLPTPIEENRAASTVKVLIKNLAIFFLFPSKEFLLIPFSKFSCWKLLTKNRRNKDKNS
jgi:hypothetical protein